MTTHLLVHYHTQTYDVSLPDDVPLHTLIPAIAHKLNLPTQQEDGAFDLFYLVYQEQILPFDQTLAQLQLPDKAEVLLEQTAVPAPQTAEDLEQQIIIRNPLAPITATIRNHRELWLALIAVAILLIFCLVPLISVTNVPTQPNQTALKADDATIPPTNTRIATATKQPTQTSTPTPTSTSTTTPQPTETLTPIPTATSPPSITTQRQHRLSTLYDSFFYAPTTNKLIGFTTSNGILSIYDLSEPVVATTEYLIQSSSYISLEQTAVQTIIQSPTNLNHILVVQKEGFYTLLDLTSATYFQLNAQDACRAIMTQDGICFAPTPTSQTTSSICPIIWRGATGYYLTRCGNIYQLQPDAPSKFIEALQLDSDVIQLIETEKAQLLILGTSQLVLYDIPSGTQTTYHIADNRSTQTSHLFLNAKQDTFYIIHRPEDATSDWLFLGRLK